MVWPKMVGHGWVSRCRRGEGEEEKKKKTKGVREGEAGCFVLILSLCIFS
jgi:hypothetical protein